jgi:hypothetical protein
MHADGTEKVQMNSMEGPPAVDSWKVLSIGIPVPPSRDPNSLPGLEGSLDPLSKAPEHAASVSQEFVRLGPYTEYDPGSTLDPNEAIETAVTTETGVLVVHIVAHGRLADQGNIGELYVVGGNGRNLKNSVETWIKSIENTNEPRPYTLFILDLCHAGVAATLHWHQQMPTSQRRAWVIAACGPKDQAFDCRLSQATAAVLGKYRHGKLRVDDRIRYIPLRTVAQEIARAVIQLAPDSAFKQEVDSNRIPLLDVGEVDELPFFPNPTYNNGLGSGTLSVLDQAFDPLHFARRAGGAEALSLDLTQGFFRGRHREVKTLAGWFDGNGPGYAVVTGKPGAGKSALLGVLICAAHPQLSEHTKPLWNQLRHKPACNERLAVVHARRQSLGGIAEAIARQMGADAARRPANGWGADDLVALAASSGKPWTIVLDALDEADQPDDVARALLGPLARRACEQAPPVRLLIGTRDQQRFSDLLQMARDTGRFVDLGSPGRDALAHYLSDLLVGTAYNTTDMTKARDALVAAIAKTLTARTRPALDWGEFLVAQLFLQHVLRQPICSDPTEAAEMGRGVPLSLPRLLELYLASRPNVASRQVLAAAAQAEGLGLPERLLLPIANALALPGAAALDLDGLRTALDDVRFYLRQDVETDGTTLYRLFHEGLADHLRLHPYQSPEGDDAR